ncbi:hypothetical protein GUITHDRAFT_156576 [Guillardia theta CCMP2712]|uniref:Uncharacterized protein n=1 Tax=Guillardia theta (strain CCMP2712) TaxID=905079 RepID=L1I5T7_GUITC|nr:hypothetical protein GUITHDRAFT_156576 [Guillardia theta CCMP2712]EKX31442.1 hypothetical protein GUITHDRAFT_156576 [Guillardia theta CCMP2712]|eukprot:XP_005818422.1 hypothetical protein GUITHDRAFT_156576 [Guillardia theta CCMP2712]
MMVGKAGGAAAMAAAAAMMMMYLYASTSKPSTELTQSLIQGQVAMGAMGGAEGLHPVPSQGPPTWERGGNTWMYDRIYGNGIRPTTGVWAQPTAVAEEPQGEQGEEQAPAGAAEEPAAEPVAAGGDGAAAAVEAEEMPAAAAEERPVAEPMNDAGVPEAPAAQPREKEVVKEVVEPDGKVREEVEPKAQASEPEAEDCGGSDCSQNPDQIIVNVPSQQAPVQQVPVPYPAPASQQLPMEWAAEDAAEHAYNLAQWRVKILKAKMEQAKLRKELMAVTMGDDSEDANEDRMVGSRGRRKGRSDTELKAVKMSLLTLAKETVSAIRQLKNQMQELKSASLRRRTGGGQETQLADVGGTQMNQALRKIKAKKTAEVLQLKKKMDNQLNSLLQKVTKLIKSRSH